MREENPFGFRLETYVLDKDDECPYEVYDTWGDAVNTISGLNQTGQFAFNSQIFKESNTARFVRLITRTGNPTSADPLTQDTNLLDSHVGVKDSRKFRHNIGEGYVVDGETYNQLDEIKLLQTTHIPENFNEWYFICATFNPNNFEPNESDAVYDQQSQNGLPNKWNPHFWMNNVDPTDGSFVANSGYGNQSKVEIISKTDLLRARGYKV